MSDASFTAAGYAIMIEVDPNQKLQSKRKTYAPIAFSSKTLLQPKLKQPNLRKRIGFYIFCLCRVRTLDVG